MIQTLEREPREDINHLHDASPAGRLPFRPGPYPMENGAPRRDNPHKYLLYKPTYSQVQVFLASGFRELPANGALLLYLSADGCFSSMKRPEESKLPQYEKCKSIFSRFNFRGRINVCLILNIELKIKRQKPVPRNFIFYFVFFNIL